MPTTQPRLLPCLCCLSYAVHVATYNFVCRYICHTPCHVASCEKERHTIIIMSPVPPCHTHNAIVTSKRRICQTCYAASQSNAKNTNMLCHCCHNSKQGNILKTSKCHHAIVLPVAAICHAHACLFKRLPVPRHTMLTVTHTPVSHMLLTGRMSQPKRQKQCLVGGSV